MNIFIQENEQNGSLEFFETFVTPNNKNKGGKLFFKTLEVPGNINRNFTGRFLILSLKKMAVGVG